MAKDFRRTGSHVPLTNCFVCLSRLIRVVIILSSVSLRLIALSQRVVISLSLCL